MSYLSNLTSIDRFARDVIKLLTASALGYGVFLLVLPTLSRLYTPEDFGLLGIFLAVCMTVSTISASGYEYTLLITEDEPDASNLLAISCFFVLTTCIIVAFLMLTLRPYLLNYSIVRKLGWSLDYIPLMVFNFGLYNVFSHWLSRYQAFKLISVARFIQLFSIAACQLVIGYFTYHSGGLIVGVIIGQQIATGFLTWHIIHKIYPENNKKIVYHPVIRNIKRYSIF